MSRGRTKRGSRVRSLALATLAALATTLPATAVRAQDSIPPVADTLAPPAADTLSPAAADTVPPPPAAVPDPPITDHVVVISIDGLRPDAIEEFGLETLLWLKRQGAYSESAETILPSKTLPSHTSMLTGLLPVDHGITFNREIEGRSNVAVPTIFELAREHGLSTAAFFSKAKFRHLKRPGAYDYWQAPSSNLDNWPVTRTVPDAVRYLRHERPNLLFVHIGEPDYAGHATGWMGTFYGWATRRADGGVARVLEAARATYGPEGFTLIVTADHGGHDRDHGSDAATDTSIPWIVWGAGVDEGARPADVHTTDTAATALWLLGIPTPAHWEGRPVVGAFDPQPRPVAGPTR